MMMRLRALPCAGKALKKGEAFKFLAVPRLVPPDGEGFVQVIRPDGTGPVRVAVPEGGVQVFSAGKTFVDPVGQDDPHDTVAVENLPLGPDDG
ncbi:hypothetical protein SDC9_50522 [bioreactor metagenome]|uniref:Uncharacterized protein n=1 Tax=bioreactor metagenome TaxID=1076179 RepID=A0A644WKY8_9ZZZZ